MNSCYICGSNNNVSYCNLCSKFLCNSCSRSPIKRISAFLQETDISKQLNNMLN